MAVCPKCDTEFTAEGKIARCPECHASFKNDPPKAKKNPAPKPKAKSNGKDQPKPKKSAEEQAAEEDMYGFAHEENLGELRQKREEKEKKAKDEKKTDAKPVIEVKRKNIGDLAVWEYIDRSMAWFLYGVFVWAVRHLLHGLILFLGMVAGPNYPRAVAEFLIRPNQPAFELGRGDVLDRVSFTMAMLGGCDFVVVTWVLTLIGTILLWVQLGLWITGAAVAWQGTEDVESGKSELITLYSLCGVDIVASILLVFLPLVGAYTYLPLPLWGTELAMCYHNIDRSTPLHVFWSYAPFLDTLLTLVVLGVRYAEPTMIVYFIWTVAARIKDERVDLGSAAQRALGMGCGVTFLLLVIELFSLTGNSATLIMLLKGLYLLWYAFVVLWLVTLVMTIGKCRDMFRFYFDPLSE